MDKRLAKRHKRQVARAKLHSKTSEPDVRTHEQIEAATDPLLNAWYDASGQEIGDKCAWNFGPTKKFGGDVKLGCHTYEAQKELDTT